MAVPVAPLADVLAALGVDRVDRLVLDCEGCEHAVLAPDGGWRAGLKGSIGEGPNHSNFSDESTVNIVSEFRKFY